MRVRNCLHGRYLWGSRTHIGMGQMLPGHSSAGSIAARAFVSVNVLARRHHGPSRLVVEGQV